MKAKSIKGISAEVIHSSLETIRVEGFHPKLATVFLYVNQNRKADSEILGKKGIDVYRAISLRFDCQTQRAKNGFGPESGF